MQIVLASRNQGKIREIKQILTLFDITLLSLDDFDDIPPVIEDGDTFLANALKKAHTVQRYTKGWVMADDSGLEVEALNGAPGVYSARFAGEDATDADNNKKLLKELDGVGERIACFRAVIVMVGPQGEEITAQGQLDGVIAETPRGEHGFGYDPLFYLPQLGKTAAELTAAEKNKISHRAKALEQLSQKLQKLRIF